MLNRILASCGFNFEASLDVNVEDHRLQWTTLANLSLWFESWERTITDEGFGHRYDKGKVIILLDQLLRIFNVDESASHLMVVVDPRLEVAQPSHYTMKIY